MHPCGMPLDTSCYFLALAEDYEGNCILVPGYSYNSSEEKGAKVD